LRSDFIHLERIVAEAILKTLLAPWERLSTSSAVLRFVDINPRDVAQVMFQNDPLSGVMFLAAIGRDPTLLARPIL
jgi:hypothetical protein